MVKHFLLGVLVSISIMACGARSYRWYTMELKSYEQGYLKGPTNAQDRPFSRCAPTEENKAPCIVMFDNEFEDAFEELASLKERLKACEEGD